MSSDEPFAANHSMVCFATQWIVLGRIRQAHGLRGEIKLQHHCASLQDLQRYKSMRCIPHVDVSATEMTDDYTGDVLRVLRCRAGRNAHEVIVAFAEITTRDHAESLVGKNLAVSRDALPSLKEEEFFHHDLLGLQAHDAQQQPLGRITAVHNFGAGDMINITRENGQEFLHPFKPEFVTDIDLVQGRCTLQGLMEQDQP